MRALARIRKNVNIFLLPTGFQIERSKDYLPFINPVPKKLLRSNIQQKQTNDFLLRFGRESDFLIDVGANRGSFTDHFRKINSDAKAMLVEPIPELCEALSAKYKYDPGVSIHRYAISDNAGEATFHITANDGQSSSLLNIGSRHLEAAPHASEIQTIRVLTTSLDELCKDKVFKNGFLKVDVQGNDLPALMGSINVLKKIAAIHIEVSIQTLYDGDVIAFKVWEFLDKNEFVLYGIDPWFRDPFSNGELLQADFFFVKKSVLSRS
jgi:FkbM family methyltransferase